MITVRDWLAARESTAPAPLSGEVRRALGADLDRDASEAAERCIAAAERLVGQLLSDGATDRDSALTLLAADALVTYAFEAAADAPDMVRARAIAAMRTLGSVA